jgi:hypothetical protein
MARKRSDAEIQAAVRIHETRANAEVVAKVFTELVKWGSLVGIAYVLAPGFEALAGKQTVAKFSVEWLMNEQTGTAMSILFGVGGIAYGRRQAKLRQEAIERLHKYQLAHEKAIDPKRTSSKLTPRGETRVEDR